MALEALFREVSAIFDQVQVSTANHRKNSVSLLKIHTKSVASVQKLTDRTQRPVGERRFTKVFVDMLGRVLVVKKGVLPADRVMKFVGAYVAYISDKGLSAPTPSRSSTDEEDSETPVSRFVAQLLKFLLQGFEAKDKSVRFRSVGTVAELIAHLGELDEDVYEELRHALLERMRDKEAAIRSQAVLALTKLMGSDTNGIDAEIDEESILGNILYSLCSDSASEVRRLALASIPLMPSTLPIILTRTRDVDPCIRSLVFSKALFHFNPAQLTIAQRETLVRDGLGDRDDKVKAAAAELVDGWFALARGDGASDFIADAMQFLKLFDLTSEDGISIATDALRSIFATRASVVSKVTFSDDYWRALTPEAAVFARCFIEYTSPNSVDASCSGIGINTSCVMENSTIPVVTAFAYYVQEACNRMLDTIEELEIIKLRGNDGETDSDDEENVLALEECEELLVQGICVFSELLKIACCLDYSDEIGRRKMFLVIRTIIGVEYLPESLIDTCVEVLKATTDEREMIKVTVEVMVELRDSLFEGQEEDDDEASEESEVEVTRSRTINNSKLGTQKRPTREWTRQEKLRADEIDLRCLSLCIAMMKRVNGQFHEHSVLEGIVSDLIIPSITRDQASHRELGLVALGLCSLTSKDMALQSFPLFCNQSQHASEGLKTKVLQIVLDLLLMHCSAFFQRSKETTEQILSFLLQTFEQEESSSVRATICVGLSKLMLNGIVTDERALAALVLAFVSPANSGNQELRQCLSCFIPAYCYSSYANQCRMQSIFFIVFELITQVYDELEPGQSMITPIQFCTLFLDWTDPQRRASGSSARPGSEDIHLNLAIDILKACYDDDRTIGRKLSCQMLPKLYLPSTPDPCTLLCLRILLENIGKCSLDDVLAQKAVAKFKAKVFKQLSKQLKSLDVREHADDSQYLDIRRIVQTRSPSPEPSSDRDTDDESEEEERPSRGRKISPMKPSVRRKARSTSLEISDDVHDASPSRSVGPPLSRTPSPSPSSSLLPTPSPGVSMIRHREDNKFKVLPFKASKKMRTTGPQRDTEFKRHRLPVTKPIVAGKARAHYLEGDRESAASSGMDVRPNHRRTRGDHVSIVVGSEDSEDSDF